MKAKKNSKIALGEKYFLIGDMASDKRQWKRAAYYFSKGAKLRNLASMSNLATLYSSGLGVRKNLEKALCLYKYVYKQGDLWVGENIALCYIDKRKFRIAERWLKKSNLKSNAGAALTLAKLYLLHWKPPRHNEALKYLRMSLHMRLRDSISSAEVEEASSLLKQLS